jgi:nicotinamidase-related amidase
MSATLDQATALVLIDLQNGITALPTAHPADDIVLRSAALANAFREHHLPVVATRVGFSADGGDVVRKRHQWKVPPSSASNIYRVMGHRDPSGSGDPFPQSTKSI